MLLPQSQWGGIARQVVRLIVQHITSLNLDAIVLGQRELLQWYNKGLRDRDVRSVG
jgi:hypothetical protein